MAKRRPADRERSGGPLPDYLTTFDVDRGRWALSADEAERGAGIERFLMRRKFREARTGFLSALMEQPPEVGDMEWHMAHGMTYLEAKKASGQ